MRKLLFITLFLIAFLERIAFDLGPNIELVTTAMVLSSVYLGRRQSLWLVFLIMFLTDLLIGNTRIFIFTWTGFLIPAFFTSSFYRKMKVVLKMNVLAGTLVGISANIFFFFWTNFGVWYLDSWGMYSDDLGGLLMSYINGLVFLKFNILSTILFVPLGFLVVYLLRIFSLIKRSHKEPAMERIATSTNSG